MSAEEYPVTLTDEEFAAQKSRWDTFIRNADGTINERNLYAELHDFGFLMEQAPQVYSHVTCGAMSKNSYYADDIIQHAEECSEYWTVVIVREVLDRIDAGETTNDIRDEFRDPNIDGVGSTE